jgi:hypothetical protein
VHGAGSEGSLKVVAVLYDPGGEIYQGFESELLTLASPRAFGRAELKRPHAPRAGIAEPLDRPEAPRHPALGGKPCIDEGVAEAIRKAVGQKAW